MCSTDEVQGRQLEPRAADALGNEIRTLGAHIHAATCRWLCLVGEFDAGEGWANTGAKSTAHWISWSCSIAPGAAREHVRVARALRGLPLIRAAFAEGRLSYSKVRALTRVETPTREADLLELAVAATASQLERLVRAYRGVVKIERGSTGRPERYVEWWHDDDGSLVLRGRLPAEEGAVVVEALAAARESLRERVPAETPPAGRHVPAETRAAIARPAGDVPAETRAAIARPAGDVPAETRAAIPDGEDAVDVPAEARPNRDHTNADALVLMADTLLARGVADRASADRHQIVVPVDADTLRAAGEGERSELADGSPLDTDTARRLACDASVVALVHRAGRPLGVGRKTRAIPTPLRRALRARDGGCRFPGCSQQRHVQAHHIHHWADGGVTDLSNLVELCNHHHRLLHEGGFTLTRQARGTLVFRRPDGRRLRAVPRPRRGDPDALPAQYHGPRIDERTCLPGWCGERLHMADGVDALLAFAPIVESPGV